MYNFDEAQVQAG